MVAILPTKREFRKATSKNVAIRKGISKIDQALAEWHKGPPTVDKSISVYKECRHWLKNKAGKSSDSANKRRIEIKNLAYLSTQWVSQLNPSLGAAFDKFETQKRRAPHQQPQQLKSMPGVYGHERAAYLASGKTHAPSASRLDVKFQSHQAQFPGKQFSELSEAEYNKLDGILQKQYPVIYMKKFERLNVMLNVQNHQLMRFDGAPYDTNGQDWPYAIGPYGNIYSTNDLAANGQFNHSSFNAGKNVVCAGMVKVVGGQLRMISNNSGHYKPTQQHLYNAMQLLAQELGRAGTAAAVVRFWDYVQEPGFVHIIEFPFATFPAAGNIGGVEQARMPAA